MNAYRRADMSAAPTAQYLAESNTSKILSLVGVFAFLALSTVSLRLFVRSVMLKYTGADDVVIALTMACGIAVFVCFVGEASHGLGRHYEVIYEDFSGYLHWEFAHSLFSLFGIAMVKVSISLLLLRLVPQKHYRRFLWAIITFLTVYTLICALTIIFSCIPVSASWNVEQHATAKCYSIQTYTGLGIANSVFTMLTDIILAVLPIPVVMKLQINMRTRVALSMVLSLGFIAVACGAVKIYYQYSVLMNKDSRFKNQFFIWAALELYLGIIACSLPSLRPLVAVALKSARSTIGHSGHGTVEQVDHSRDARCSRGYKKHGDLESSGSETALKSSALSAITPASIEYEANHSDYFGVNTVVAYEVDAERSFSDAIPLDDLASSSPGANAKSLEKGERPGIMRTMKIVTHSESIATPHTVPSSYISTHDSYFVGASKAAANGDAGPSSNEVVGSRPSV